MNAPTLLRTDTEFSLPMSVFDDLGVRRIFDGEIISTLSHPCRADVIKLRQELFRMLDDEDFRGKFASFGRDITSLSRLCALYKASHDGISRFFILCELEKKFAAVCESTKSLRGCALTDELADFWGDGLHTSLLERIASATAEADAILSSISRFDISLHDKTWVTPDYESVSYAEGAADCARRLGFDTAGLSRARVKSLPLDAAVDAPLSRLREAELSELRETLVPYEELDCGSLTRLSHDVSFYLDMWEFTEKIRARGIGVCFPTVSGERKYTAKNAYDVTLTAKGAIDIVPNDIDLDETRPFSFLVGANGGGKTTYLRCAGVNLLLFLSGAPIFAEAAEIFPFRRIGTHFPADERMSDVGRLHDEMRRASAMLDTPSGDGGESFLLFNETFSGTNDARGRELAADVAERMTSERIFGIYVTHFNDIDGDGKYPCLEAVVEGEDGKRTFKISQRHRGGGSFASDIMKKYGLDERSLEKRRRGGVLTP